MSAATESNTCPLCAEEIRVAAKKCPHCGHWQTKWHTTIHHPGFSALFFIPLLAIWIASVIWVERVFEPADPAAFSDHIDEFVVMQSDVSLDVSGEKTMVSTVGVLKNNGPLPWEDVSVEVQYFNASGALIDTDRHTMLMSVVLPGQEAGFRIRQEANHPEGDYHEHKVYVRSGKVPGRW